MKNLIFAVCFLAIFAGCSREATTNDLRAEKASETIRGQAVVEEICETLPRTNLTRVMVELANGEKVATLCSANLIVGQKVEIAVVRVKCTPAMYDRFYIAVPAEE